MNKVIKIGTRGSKLAMWQAQFVADSLQKGNIKTEIIPIETKGDKILDVAIGKIGSKGVFTEEIEAYLRSGEIDIAVHSAKDLQSSLSGEFELIAFTKREVPNDVLVGNNKNVRLEDGSDWLIGSSSTRRVSFLKHYYPNIKTIAVRGNLQTRLRKMEEGQCDALLLAYAGVHRMNFDHLILEKLPVDIFTPAVGQGSIAIEIKKDIDNEIKGSIRQWVNDEDTEVCLRAERSFLKTLEGGCSIPVFGYAVVEYDQLILKGGVISLDGKQIVQDTFTGYKNAPVETGMKLGHKILSMGGEEILATMR